MNANALMTTMRQRFSGNREAAEAIGVTVFSCLFLILFGNKLVSSWSQFLAVTVLVFAAAIATVRYRVALLLFIVFLFAYEEFDISSKEAFAKNVMSNSVIMVRIFGVSLMDFAAVILLLPVLIREWKRAMETGAWRWMKVDLLLLPLLALWLYGVVNGLFHTLTLSTFTWDLRDLGYIFILYFVFSRTFTEKRDYVLVFSIASVVYILKNGLFLFRLLRGGGLQIGQEYTRILLGSDLNLTAFFLCLCVGIIISYDALPKVYKYALILVSLYLTIILLAGLGRLTYLLTALALVMIFVLNRKKISARSILVFIGFAITGLLLFYFVILGAANREVISYAFTSAFNWWDAVKLYSDLSLGTRLLEILNTWATLNHAGALLWGLGWGAPWKEIAILQPFDSGASSVEEQLSGVHFEAHIDAIKFLLKLGIIGTSIMYWAFYRFWKKGILRFHFQTNAKERMALLAVLLMLVIFVPNFVYYTRLKFLIGLALAGVAVFTESEESHA